MHKILISTSKYTTRMFIRSDELTPTPFFPQSQLWSASPKGDQAGGVGWAGVHSRADSPQGSSLDFTLLGSKLQGAAFQPMLLGRCPEHLMPLTLFSSLLLVVILKLFK